MNQKTLEFSYDASPIFKRDDLWLHGREPVLRRMPNGDLIVLFYSGGKTEPDPNNVAAIIRSEDDGRTWTTPEILFKHDTRCSWPTEIFTEGPRPFAVIQTYEYGGYFSELRASLSYTEDNGRTWTEPSTVMGVPPNFSVRQGKVLSDGTWCFPVYWVEQDGNWNFDLRKTTIAGIRNWRFSSAVIRSTNQGESFSLHGYLRHPIGFWEPEIIELEPAHLLMYLRCDQGGGVLWQSESFDFGLTWSPAIPSAIPSSGTKVVMFKIEDHIVLVHNPTPTGRRRLELWVSRDNTRTWSKKILLAEITDVTGGEKSDGQRVSQLGNWTTDIICYPHGFVDEPKRLLYLACDAVDAHYLIKVPFEDFITKGMGL